MDTIGSFIYLEKGSRCVILVGPDYSFGKKDLINLFSEVHEYVDKFYPKYFEQGYQLNISEFIGLPMGVKGQINSVFNFGRIRENRD